MAEDDRRLLGKNIAYSCSDGKLVIEINLHSERKSAPNNRYMVATSLGDAIIYLENENLRLDVSLSSNLPTNLS